MILRLLFTSFFIMTFLHAEGVSQEQSNELLIGHMPLHCPDTLRTQDLLQFEIAYGGITHHEITYPKWLDDYPVTRAMFVTMSRQTESEQAEFRRFLDCDFLSDRQIINSMKLMQNLTGRNASSVITALAKLRIAENERNLLENLSDEQLTKIDGTFFWLLSRNDGILATVASNKYVYERLNAAGVPLSKEQISSIEALSEELFTDLSRMERQLLADYRKTLLSLLPEQIVSDLGELRKLKASLLVPQFLDIAACDTRMLLEDREFKSPILGRKYDCRTFEGLRIRPQIEDSILDPQVEIEIAFLTSLVETESQRSRMPRKSRQAVRELIKDMQTEIAQVDQEFAKRGAAQKDRGLWRSNIERVVDLTIERFTSDHPDLWKSLNPELAILKVRCIGPSYIESYLDEDSVHEFREQLDKWLNRYDRTVHDAERSMLDRVTGLLDKRQKELVGQLFDRRPVSKCNALSLIRLNTRFIFSGE